MVQQWKLLYALFSRFTVRLATLSRTIECIVVPRLQEALAANSKKKMRTPAEGIEPPPPPGEDAMYRET